MESSYQCQYHRLSNVVYYFPAVYAVYLIRAYLLSILLNHLAYINGYQYLFFFVR